MEKYNKKRNIIFNPNKVQKWNVEKNTIITTSRNHVDKLSEPFDYLRKNANDGYSNYQELIEANTIARKKAIAKVKRLELEKTAGYVTISTLTIIITLVISIVIFITIGTILGG